MFERSASWALVLVSLAGAASAQQGQDTIRLVGSDKPLKGKITDETLGEVVVQVSGATVKHKWESIQGQGAGITYGEGENHFKPVLEALEKNDPGTAVGLLEKMKPAELRAIFVPRRLMLLGRAYEMLGKNKEAEDQYKELVDKHKQSRYVRDATKALVGVQIKNKNFAGAVATADLGIKLAQEGKLEALALDFRTVKGSVLEAQNELDRADAEYRAVASAAASVDPRVAALANVGQARIAALKQDAVKAKALLEAPLKSNDPTILGPAHAAMGEALLSEGMKANNAEKVREAAWEHFLRVVVQFPPVGAESQDSLELAMYGNVRAYHALLKLEKAKESTDLWNTYGATACADFGARFGNSSRYAKQVDELRKDFKTSAK